MPKRNMNSGEENLNEDNSFEEQKIFGKPRITNNRSKSPNYLFPTYMKEVKMNFEKEGFEANKEQPEEQVELYKASGANTLRVPEFTDLPTVEGKNRLSLLHVIYFYLFAAAIENIDEHVIKVQENMLGEVEDDEFSEDYEEELLIK